MPLKYLIDEHLRGDFLQALVQAGSAKGFAVDVLEVGEAPDPRLSTPDNALLLWCETAGRILVSRDFSTLAPCLAAHVEAGHTCPGIFLIRLHASWSDVLEDLVCLAEASSTDEWRNQILFIPFG